MIVSAPGNVQEGAQTIGSIEPVAVIASPPVDKESVFGNDDLKPNNASDNLTRRDIDGTESLSATRSQNPANDETFDNTFNKELDLEISKPSINLQMKYQLSCSSCMRTLFFTWTGRSGIGP